MLSCLPTGLKLRFTQTANGLGVTVKIAFKIGDMKIEPIKGTRGLLKEGLQNLYALPICPTANRLDHIKILYFRKLQKENQAGL